MPGFPENIIDVLADEIGLQMKGLDAVLKRPLKPIDPDITIGIFTVDWEPSLPSAEMGGGLRTYGPTLGAYQFRIQYLIKHGDEEEGRTLYALGTKNLRSILAGASDLRVRLGELDEVSLGLHERVQRFGVRNQKFLNNEIQGTFMYLSSTDFWVETESLPI